LGIVAWPFTVIADSIFIAISFGEM
jgi:hypothetical protein